WVLNKEKINQTPLQKEKDQNHMQLHAKLEKLEILEKECFRLSTTQRTAEDKIKQLEEKLREEEHQRKLIQDKAAQLQTGLEINRILTSSVSSQNEPTKKSRKKKTAKVTCKFVICRVIMSLTCLSYFCSISFVE
uniref:Centrosomal protein 57 like 1 n=1 Tax=Chelonoidis abingdonii TaxID=106734 RepID=A0A8C0HAV7_CHEAB